MNNLELALKIKAIVSGLKDVEALAAGIGKLAQQSAAQPADVTAALREGMAEATAGIKELVAGIATLAQSSTRITDPTAAARAGIEQTDKVVREIREDLDAISHADNPIEDPTVRARSGIEQTGKALVVLGHQFDDAAENKQTPDPTAAARDGIDQTGKALQKLDADFERIDNHAKPKGDPTADMRRGALTTLPTLDKLVNELGQVEGIAKRRFPDPTPILRQGLKLAQDGAKATGAYLSELRASVLNIRNAVAGGIVFFATRDVTQAATAAERIERGLKAAFGSAEAGAREYAFVRAEVDRLGLSLESTASEYVRLAAASKGTRLEGQATRDIFTAVVEASTVLGLSAENTTGTLNAIQQMMSKGSVQAEELRGQLGDRLPGAVQIAARALNVTTGQLGKMLEQGQIASDVFLPRFAAELRKTFGNEVPDAANSAQAGINRFFTTLFELKVEFARSGFLKELIGALNDVREILRDPTFRDNLRDVGAGLGNLVRGTAQFFGGLRLITSGPSDAFQKLDTQVSAIDAKIKDLQEALDKPRAVRGFKVFGLKNNVGGTVKTEETPFISDEAINKRLDELRKERQTIVDNMDKIISERGRKIDKPEAPPAALPPFKPPAGKSSTTAALNELRALVDAQNKLVQDGLTRAERLLDEKLADGLVSYRAYYAERARLETEAVDAEIAQTRRELEAARKAVKSAPDEGDRLEALAKVHKVEADLVILERKRGDIAGQAARAQAQAEKELAATLDQVQIALLQAQGRTADARTLEIAHQYSDTIKRLQLEGKEAGEKIVSDLINVEVARAQLDQLRAEYDRTMSQMQVDEQRISNDRDAGLKTEIEARREIVSLHQRTSQELIKLIPQMEALSKSVGPEAAADVARISEELRRMSLVVDEVAARVNGSLQTGLTQLFDDAAAGAKKGMALVEEFGNTVIATIRRIAAEQAATQILGAFNGTGFGQFVGKLFGGSGSGAAAAVHHTGGVVGAVAASRTV